EGAACPGGALPCGAACLPRAALCSGLQHCAHPLQHHQHCAGGADWHRACVLATVLALVLAVPR
ncbi:hypothetical protein NL445_29305, partial [Klebsiella pneumoniae]|nr:hypothetical protein [Klebsiella pneumoniae]